MKLKKPTAKLWWKTSDASVVTTMNRAGTRAYRYLRPRISSQEATASKASAASSWLALPKIGQSALKAFEYASSHMSRTEISELTQ